MKINYKKFFKILTITFIIGNLFAVFLMGPMKEYALINKPALSPPGIVFPIVWSILFLLMSISFYMITETKSYDKEKSYILYFAQLIVNSLWTLIFFGFKAYLFAFIWIILLIILVIMMIIEFYKLNKTSAYLQIPYLLWLLFASYLNIMVYILNR